MKPASKAEVVFTPPKFQEVAPTVVFFLSGGWTPQGLGKALLI